MALLSRLVWFFADLQSRKSRLLTWYHSVVPTESWIGGKCAKFFILIFFCWKRRYLVQNNLCMQKQSSDAIGESKEEETGKEKE